MVNFVLGIQLKDILTGFFLLNEFWEEDPRKTILNLSKIAKTTIATAENWSYTTLELVDGSEENTEVYTSLQAPTRSVRRRNR